MAAGGLGRRGRLGRPSPGFPFAPFDAGGGGGGGGDGVFSSPAFLAGALVVAVLLVFFLLGAGGFVGFAAVFVAAGAFFDTFLAAGLAADLVEADFLVVVFFVDVFLAVVFLVESLAVFLATFFFVVVFVTVFLVTFFDAVVFLAPASGLVEAFFVVFGAAPVLVERGDEAAPALVAEDAFFAGVFFFATMSPDWPEVWLGPPPRGRALGQKSPTVGDLRPGVKMGDPRQAGRAPLLVRNPQYRGCSYRGSAAQPSTSACWGSGSGVTSS